MGLALSLTGLEQHEGVNTRLPTLGGLDVVIKPSQYQAMPLMRWHIY